MKWFSVTNDQGITFNVVMVELGEKYGLDNCLTHDKEPPFDQPLIEFYDSRHGSGQGQFIGRYYMDTLMKRNQDYGLDLHGGIPAWSIDKESMLLVHDWLSAMSVCRY